MEVWLTKTPAGLRAADEDSAKLLEKIQMGNTFPADVPIRQTRSGKWNARYWVLCKMLADNVEQVEIEPDFIMPIKSKEDVHVAFKYITGLYDSYAFTGKVVRVIKFTAFDTMSADDWAEYWKKCMDAVHQKFLPGISLPSVEDEIARMAS